MRKPLAMFALLVFVSAAVAAEAPHPAGRVPAAALAFFSVRDVRPLVPAAVELLEGFEGKPAQVVRGLLQNIEPVLGGRVSLALLPPGADQTDVRPLLAVEVDESKVKADEALVKAVTQVAGADNVEFSVTGGIHELKSKEGRARVFWTVEKNVVYLAAERSVVEGLLQAPEGKAPPCLADAESWRALAKHVDWSADLIAYVDLEKTVWRELRPAAAAGGPAVQAQWVFPWLAPDQFRAAGFSWKGAGKTGSGRLAVVTPAERKGIAALLDLPNAELTNLERIPENCQAMLAGAPPGPDLVKRFTRFLSDLDPEVGKEFEDDLAEFSKELGVDLEKDLLANLGSITTAARLPGEGDFAVYNAVVVADAAKVDKCAEALAAYNKTPLRKVERNGRTFKILPTKPPTGYTADGGVLYYSNSFEAVEEMFALKQGGRSLADSASLKTLRARLPEKAVFLLAVDANYMARMGGTALALIPQLRGNLPLSTVSKLLQPFQEAAPGFSFGVALRNEPGAFVVHVESLAGDLLKELPSAARLLAELAAAPRKEAQKVKSMSNLHVIALAAIAAADAHKQKLYPASLKELLDAGKLGDREVLICPASGARAEEGKFVCDYDSAMERAGFRLDDEKAPVELMMVWEKQAFFGGGRHAAFFDTHVEWLTEAEFARRLGEVDKWIAANKPK